MHTQGFRHTFRATGAGLKHRFVTYTGTQAGAAGVVLGIAATDFAAGDDVTADIAGVASVEAGGAVDIGAWVISDADGRAVTNDGTSIARIGRALNAVTGPGQTLFIKF